MHQPWSRPTPEARKPADDISGFRLEALCYFLRNTKVFADLPEQDLRDLATVATIRFLEKGAYLFHKDEAPPGLCLVRRGIVNFHRVAMDGREVVIHFYREGEVLPEIASDSDSGCPADARAVVASEVIIIPRRSFLSKVRTCPELALRVLASMDQQVHQIADSLEDIVSKNASTRFVHWLLKQCGGPGSRESVEIDLGTTKRALASELGVRQETLSRTLRQLTESGYLRVRGRHITVKSPQALRKAWVNDARCAAAA
jgi:cAMP-binding proteins - catabolite gene activator and regulatory subunit of cAMP-dependent protein kinases